MVDNPDAALQYVVRLAECARRAQAANDLARRCGGDALLMFVRDPTIDVLVPAPGFPQTVRGGASWRELMQQLRRPGRCVAEVEVPPGHTCQATAVANEDLAMVLLGTEAPKPEFEPLVEVMPLLAATFRAEQQAFLSDARAAEADSAARRTRELVGALDAARAEAWRLNAELTLQHRQRDDFLAMLAHELRNPLAPLVTALAVMRRGGSAIVGTQLEIMERQLRQLSRMVDDLLDVSRVRHGKIVLRREPLTVREILNSAIDASRPLLDARGHALEVRLPESALTIDADPVRLTQVFSNLLHNAAKYTDPGGAIRVQAVRDGDEALVSIQDNGVGIDPAVLPHVFDLFVQAPVARDRAQGGLGIGLTLVRSLVELHGGSVGAFSEGPGCGSRFEVRLPLHDSVPVRAPRPSAGPSDAALPPLRILVVDDNRDLTESLSVLLRFMGHMVDVAHNGWHALQIAADVDPDVVFLDIGLPDLDGHEAGRRLRRIIRTDAVLLAMTGYGSDNDRKRSLDAGFDDHLVKPVDPGLLEPLLGRAYQRRTAATRVD